MMTKKCRAKSFSASASCKEICQTHGEGGGRKERGEWQNEIQNASENIHFLCAADTYAIEGGGGGQGAPAVMRAQPSIFSNPL